MILLLLSLLPPVERPHVVLVMSDDMGYSDIGCYGGEIETPTLDALAENGLRFTQFYNQGRCCPTRASLLTGLYPHQAGIGHMEGDYGLPAYRGELNRSCVTLAEVLGDAGYRCVMAGKWHVTRNVLPDADRSHWPLQRGFERFYGTIRGGGSYYDPVSLCRGNTFLTPENDPGYRPERFYYTDAITDNAVAFLREHFTATPDRPVFAYVSYTTAHWPLHALPEDIARVKGRYDAGYAAVRGARVDRMRALGILPESWDTSPTFGDWARVTDRGREASLMEVYAAMVESMDRGIGRIVAELEAHGALENTLFLYLQDNGACAEDIGWAPMDPDAEVEPLGPDDLQTQIWPPMQTRDGRIVRTDVPPGPDDSYLPYYRAWANVSNTPFREYKHFVHEGGIATPLVVHWPAGVVEPGRWNRQPAHLVDVMATLVDVTQSPYPAARGGHAITPPEGVSLAPAFAGGEIEREGPLVWEHEGNRAVRDGRWKLVAKGRRGKWQLHDMAADRTEMHDLAAEHPERVAAMAAQYEAWAARVGAVPFGSWNDKGAK